MVCPGLEKENIIKHVGNTFRLEKEIDDTAIKDIRNYFRLRRGNKVIKDRMLRDIRNLFEHEDEENYYKAVRVSNFWSNNSIEYESNDDKNQTLSVEEYLNKIRIY